MSMDRLDPELPTRRSIGSQERKQLTPVSKLDMFLRAPEPKTTRSKRRPSDHSDKAHNPTARSIPRLSQTDSPSTSSPIDMEPNPRQLVDARRNRNRSRTASHHSRRG